MSIYEGGKEKRRVNVEACFAEVNGAISTLKTLVEGEFKVMKVEQKAIRSHLQRLNTYNKHCEERHVKQEEEIGGLKAKCENHLTAEKTKSKMKGKFSNNIVLYIGLIINFAVMIFFAIRIFT